MLRIVSLAPCADFGLIGSRTMRAVTDTDSPLCVGEYISVLVPGRCSQGFDGESCSGTKVECNGDDKGETAFFELDSSLGECPRNEALLSMVVKDVDRDTDSLTGGVGIKLSRRLNPSNVLTLFDMLAPMIGLCFGSAGTGSAGRGGHCGSAVDKLFVLPALLTARRKSDVLI